MPIAGTRIASYEDELGPIYVYQSRTQRILSFDGHIEQSAVNLKQPDKLAYNYTQAMMSALLFRPVNKSVMIMGLGAGSLVHKLLTHTSVGEIHAVEYREKVIELAHRYFYLPESPRVQFHVDDAIKFIQKTPIKTDIIFSDLYHASGMEPRQLQTRYLDYCIEALNEEGILVLNLWQQDYYDNKEIEAIIAETFDDNIITFTVESGNTIVLAFNGLIPSFNRKDFLKQGKLMEELLDTPLAKFAKLIWSCQSHKFSQSL